MKGLFGYNGPIFNVLSRVTDILWLNVLYIICCIPIITIGAATTSLYYVTMKMAKNEEGYVAQDFFKSFKQNFKQSTCIWAIFLVVIIMLTGDIRIIGSNSISALFSGGSIYAILIAGGFIGLISLFTFVYVFAVLARFENTALNIIKYAFLMSIKHIPHTLLMILISALPFVLIYVNGKLSFILIVAFSLVAYTNSFILNRIFISYEAAE